MRALLSSYFLIAAILLSVLAFAEDDYAPLGPPPERVHPVWTLDVEGDFFPLNRFRSETRARRSDLEVLVGLQTSVKSQGKRGTCSIFSATGMLESLLKIEFEEELDLSENYLEFLVMDKMKWRASEGSSAGLNIPAFRYYGTVTESVWPYEIYDWTKTDLPSTEKKRVKQVCGKLEGNAKQVCLLSHLKPGDDRYDEDAREFRYEYELRSLKYRVLNRERDIKRAINKGYPLILGVEFFYGAWNHRLMPTYGIGKRDMDKWKAGTVSTPSEEDIEASRKHPAGHSFVVVGYDDHKQVYYFKNSWGTDSFGKGSDLLGEESTAGYGTISYEYAHNYGSFYRVSF